MEPPSESDPQKKEVDGKTYYWCPGHKFWTMHSPKECTLLHPEKKVAGPTVKKPKAGAKLTFAEAAMAAEEEDHIDGQESEEDA